MAVKRGCTIPFGGRSDRRVAPGINVMLDPVGSSKVALVCSKDISVRDKEEIEVLTLSVIQAIALLHNAL